jgi:hypothetical protein
MLEVIYEDVSKGFEGNVQKALVRDIRPTIWPTMFQIRKPTSYTPRTASVGVAFLLQSSVETAQLCRKREKGRGS